MQVSPTGDATVQMLRTRLTFEGAVELEPHRILSAHNESSKAPDCAVNSEKECPTSGQVREIWDSRCD